MYGQINQLDDARQSLAMAVDQLTKLVALDANESRDRHDLAICYNNLSYVERDVDHAAAELAAQRAITTLAKLADENPNEYVYRADLALFHNNLGAIRGRDGRWESACQSYDRAIALQRQLVRQAPHVVGYRQGLAASLTNLGQSQAAGGDIDAALRTFEESKQHAERLVDDFPTEVQFHSLLGGVLNNQAMIQEESGQLDAALENYAAAIIHQRKAFELAPRMSDFREFLSKHYFNYGRALRSAGKPAQAGEMALERRQLWPKHGRHLYEVAVELATAVEQLAEQNESDEDSATSSRFAREAKLTWNDAVAAGYDPADAPRSLDGLPELSENWAEPTTARAEGL
jgi:tetratricopeptide (TPR) repeat protein